MDGSWCVEGVGGCVTVLVLVLFYRTKCDRDVSGLFGSFTGRGGMARMAINPFLVGVDDLFARAVNMGDVRILSFRRYNGAIGSSLHTTVGGLGSPGCRAVIGTGRRNGHAGMVMHVSGSVVHRLMVLAASKNSSTLVHVGKGVGPSSVRGMVGSRGSKY